MIDRYRRILCDTPRMVRIRLHMQTIKILRPLESRDASFYETHEALSMELARECVAAQTQKTIDHVGCESGVLEPWHDECKIHDL